MNTLNFLTIEPKDHLVQPEEFAGITPDSPAATIFTDFREHAPPVINAEMTAVEAERLMSNEYVSLKLVVDSNREFIGLVTYEQLCSQNILKQVANGYSREEIKVTDLMIPRERVSAIDYSELNGSTIAELVATLKLHGEYFCLVVDKEEHHIRGVISASEIAKRLHVPVVIERSPTFAEIFIAIVK
ncbi:MAG: CBS domain-containing protein [Exilibacterium sp.]